MISFSYDQKKQKLTSDYWYLYAYDNNGNLISKQEQGLSGKVTNYIYNSSNQLIEVEHSYGGQIVGEVKFYYDPLGRRLKKENTAFTTNPITDSKKYEYDGNEILGVYDGPNNVLVTYTPSFLRTDDMLSMDVTASGVSKGIAPSAGNYFFVKDHLGSVNEIRSSSGALVQRYQYGAFGNIQMIFNGAGTDITGSPVVAPHITYTGREYDEETKLYYYRARYYDPSIGRFLQTDPHPGRMSSPLTINNKYIYVINNPMKYRDPNGKHPILIGIGVGAIIGGIISGIQNGWTLNTVLTGAFSGAVAGGLVATGGFLGTSWMAGSPALGGAIGGGLMGGASSFTSSWITGSEWTWTSFFIGVGFGALSGGIYGAVKGAPSGNPAIDNLATGANDVNRAVGTSFDYSSGFPTSPTPVNDLINNVGDVIDFMCSGGGCSSPLY